MRKWPRAPDKTAHLGDIPVMFWLTPGSLMATCGEVEIEVYHSTGFGQDHYRAPIRLPMSGYSGKTWPAEPAPEEFEAYVWTILESLQRQGEL